MKMDGCLKFLAFLCSLLRGRAKERVQFIKASGLL